MTATPGSRDAIDNGCLCPAVDNDYGKGIHALFTRHVYEGFYWINPDCLLHGNAPKYTNWLLKTLRDKRYFVSKQGWRG